MARTSRGVDDGSRQRRPEMRCHASRAVTRAAREPLLTSQSQIEVWSCAINHDPIRFHVPAGEFTAKPGLRVDRRLSAAFSPIVLAARHEPAAQRVPPTAQLRGNTALRSHHGPRLTLGSRPPPLPGCRLPVLFSSLAANTSLSWVSIHEMTTSASAWLDSLN